MEKLFSESIADFYFGLNPLHLKVENGIDVLYPYKQEDVRDAINHFYSAYYSDRHPRIFIMGINPGRFGGGITGIPFTDPIRLRDKACIAHNFPLKPELSSTFIYDMIDMYGGIKKFTKDFFLTALCPLGFTKGGKNYNYYDDPELERIVRPFIRSTMTRQLHAGADRSIAVCLGQGKNFKYLTGMNSKEQWFEKVVCLPHPRWIMQYRRMEKDKFATLYCETLKEILPGK